MTQRPPSNLLCVLAVRGRDLWNGNALAREDLHQLDCRLALRRAQRRRKGAARRRESNNQRGDERSQQPARSHGRRHRHRRLLLGTRATRRTCALLAMQHRLCKLQQALFRRLAGWRRFRRLSSSLPCPRRLCFKCSLSWGACCVGIDHRSGLGAAAASRRGASSSRRARRLALLLVQVSDGNSGPGLRKLGRLPAQPSDFGARYVRLRGENGGICCGADRYREAVAVLVEELEPRREGRRLLCAEGDHHEQPLLGDPDEAALGEGHLERHPQPIPSHSHARLEAIVADVERKEAGA
mmetsp:Transcript_12675/g.37363  ORF Transcript_12675/g.37363 Transcript_12675/m.37363 type:complete len:297 (-) Transcript_12675:4001-4891(-)